MSSERAVGELLDLLASPGRTVEGPERLRRTPHVDKLRRGLRHPNVVGLGVARKVTDRTTLVLLGLTYYVVRKRARAHLADDELIPETIAGPDGRPIATDVVEVGVLRPEANVHRSPIGPGYSVGHVGGDTGTLGAIVVRDRRAFVLSNSHVLARCGLAKKGDAILYPGGDDGGKKSKDVIGHLADFVKLKARGINTVDTAIAEIDAARIDDVVARVGNLGVIKATTRAKIGMEVEKVGRTSGLTRGEVISTKFRPLRLPYDDVGDLSFEDQILISRFTKPGDSGALVVDRKTRKAVGLHFAGAKGGSVSAPIQRVLELMDVKLATRDP